MIADFRKQFVVGPRKVQLAQGWRSFDIAADLVLSCCPDLDCRPLRSADGDTFFLLGQAISGVSENIVEEVAHLASRDVERQSAFWAGRWALIGEQFCLEDAAALMGIYYRRDGDRIWLSSSPAILGAHIPGLDPSERIAWKVAPRHGTSAVINPATSRRSVFKLLNWRRIESRDGRIEPLTDLPEEGPGQIEFLTAVMKHWHDSQSGVPMLALTAGLDTRTIVAVAAKTGLDYKTRTLATKEASDADRTMPPKIAAAVGFEHRFVRTANLPAAERTRRWDAALAQTDGMIIHPIWRRYADGQLDEPGGVAHGVAFEVGSCYYWNKLGAEQPVSAERLIQLFFGSKAAEPYDEWLASAQRWLDTLSEDLVIPIDWRDRFFLEQRLGGFSSNTQRSVDLSVQTWFYPSNSLWYMKLMLDLPVEERRRSKAQRSLLRELSPVLAAKPVNKKSLRENTGRVIGRIRSKIRR